MNPFFQAVDWLVGRIEEIPAVALRSGIVTGDDPLTVQLPGEDPAPMRRLGPAPLDASGMVLSVGPARVWLGALDQDDGGSDTGWRPLPVAAGTTGGRYRVRDGVVHMGGSIGGTFLTSSSPITVATLPPEARPDIEVWAQALSYADRVGEMRIQTTGVISLGVDPTIGETDRIDLTSIPPWLVD